ncbi:putative bifunctional diguanylate cyclase/phosphodiesterase [Chenggangzhangella methanolivorans]|uniref:EAL domain-containing protein n=1 Tax=Chenggangzhangella methanolivorans TaxID=1437009 RepID=A0A9E6RDI0_9HYPH|nr:EAL domain-containing protein [Chenggangzhangella methanolivorans]QZO01329.1 EAL domain-containing protein [Chenggangzhangella methanolivorans]
MDRHINDFLRLTSDWFWEIDAERRVTFLSDNSEAISGRPQADLLGRERAAWARTAEERAIWDDYHAAIADRREIRDFVFPYRHPDGGKRWFELSGAPIYDEDGAFAGYRGVGSDVTSQHEARDALAEQVRRFDAALENMSQGLCMFDADARLVVVNNRYCDMFGLKRDILRVGMTQREIVEELVTLGRYQKGLTVDKLCEGTRTSLALDHAAPVHRELADGRVIAVSHRPMDGGGWVATFEDVTERRRTEARIAHMARHDALTDLPNRVALREVGGTLSRDGAGGRLSVLCLDLDRFKAVNDAHGHSVGDALLRAIADRLRTNVRDVDLVVRLGGDEFSVLHRVKDENAAVTLAHRLISIVSAPYDLGGIPVQIGVSIGVALSDEAGDDVERLLKNADMALYHAKSLGRGVASVFTLVMDENAQQRIELERDLREALRNGDFELHYQPLVELGDDAIKGFEALARWRHPTKGPISPATFIPIAEETGLIVPLGEWILNQACRDAATWPGDVSVAVNVSAVQLRRQSFAQSVLLALATSGLRADRLELEITESVLLDDTEANLETLHLLRRMGIRIAMDDFGTGYSSLSYLRRFPFDKVKIDQSFLRNADASADGAAIIRALVGLGSSLGITTLVEGVETADQLAAVRAEGAQQVQGFLFSPPKPAHEAARMLGVEAREPARKAAVAA